MEGILTSLVVVHGGVDMPLTEECLGALRRAAGNGWSLRPDPVESVVAALVVLEDDPQFNAGYGSVLNSDGIVEVDAAIVDGTRMSMGAVGGVSGLRHPSRVAAAVMMNSSAALLSGVGARVLADQMQEPDEDLVTQAQQEVWTALKLGKSRSLFTGAAYVPNTETVGAIALYDSHVVAGTSTGGVCGKPQGRIGDSAIFGAGHWADTECAVLCSGEGEAIIRVHLARRVAEAFKLTRDLRGSVDWGVDLLFKETGAVCAVVALDVATGDVSAAHNGFAFPVVVADATGDRVIEVRTYENQR
jgi:L-asparaginase / beta-aspartyl-peptidase